MPTPWPYPWPVMTNVVTDTGRASAELPEAPPASASGTATVTARRRSIGRVRASLRALRLADHRQKEPANGGLATRSREARDTFIPSRSTAGPGHLPRRPERGYFSVFR